MATHPWRRKFLLGEFRGQRILEVYSPSGCKESDTTERLSMDNQGHQALEENQEENGKKRKRRAHSKGNRDFKCKRSLKLIIIGISSHLIERNQLL